MHPHVAKYKIICYRWVILHPKHVLITSLQWEASMATQPTQPTQPTPEQCAGAILAIFVWHFGLLAGDTLRPDSFLTLWQQRGYRPKDFDVGVQFAIERRWLELLPDGKSYRLTKTGFAAA